MGESRNGYFVMSSRYGSHVLRQLLSLFSGVSLESSSKSGSSRKGAASLAHRLGTKSRTPEQSRGHSFPNQLKILMETLLEGCQQNMEELRASSAAGPVLQVKSIAVLSHLTWFPFSSTFLLTVVSIGLQSLIG